MEVKLMEIKQEQGTHRSFRLKFLLTRCQDSKSTGTLSKVQFLDPFVVVKSYILHGEFLLWPIGRNILT